MAKKGPSQGRLSIGELGEGAGTMPRPLTVFYHLSFSDPTIDLAQVPGMKWREPWGTGLKEELPRATKRTQLILAPLRIL